MISFRASSASFLSLHIYTPLPSARPSAFITVGYLQFSRYCPALSGSSKHSYSAVGMEYFFIRSFEKALEPSSIAAFFLGPNTLSPSFSKASTIPAHKGSSIPIILRSIPSFFTRAIKPSKSITDMSAHSAIPAIPALPGAA